MLAGVRGLRADLGYIFCSLLCRVACVGLQLSRYRSSSLRSLLISEVPVTVNLLIRFCQSVPQKQATSRRQL